MEKLSLNVVIGGRTYPLKVNVGEEVQIQKAAEDINRAIQLLQENYAVKDMQDLLAMSSLQRSSASASSPHCAAECSVNERPGICRRKAVSARATALAR